MQNKTHCSGKVDNLYKRHKETIRKAARRFGERQPKEFVEDLESIGTLALIEFDMKKKKDSYDDALIWTLTSREMIRHIKACAKQNAATLIEEDEVKSLHKNERLTDYEQLIDILVSKLPLQEKLVIKLLYWGDISEENIGRILKISRKKVSKIKNEAIMILRSSMAILGSKKAKRYV